jgi:chromosome segregation ATPase
VENVVKTNNSQGDVTNALLLEHLKAIQSTLARHSEELRKIRERLGILKMQYASLSNRMDRLDKRVERIETRLGLVDAKGE